MVWDFPMERSSPHLMGFWKHRMKRSKKYKAEHADYWFKVFESFGTEGKGDIVLGDDEVVSSIIETSDEF